MGLKLSKPSDDEAAGEAEATQALQQQPDDSTPAAGKGGRSKTKKSRRHRSSNHILVLQEEDDPAQQQADADEEAAQRTAAARSLAKLLVAAGTKHTAVPVRIKPRDWPVSKEPYVSLCLIPAHAVRAGSNNGSAAVQVVSSRGLGCGPRPPMFDFSSIYTGPESLMLSPLHRQ